MRFYLDGMLVRGWLGNADGADGGAKPPTLPLSSATVVHMFEHAVEIC